MPPTSHTAHLVPPRVSPLLRLNRLGSAAHPDPCPAIDKAFEEWETPLIWKWVSSKLKVDIFFQGRRALHFRFEKRTPPEVWKTNWTLWYDAALVCREDPPDDLDLTAEVAFEEVTTGFGSDNNAYVRPWIGLVARMVDLRRYYFFCLEYPDQVVLYRREDDYWLPLARRTVDLDVFTPYRLDLKIRGARFEGYVDGHPVLTRTDYAYGAGKAGIRANCTAFVTDLELSAPVRSVHAFSIRQAREAEVLEELRAQVPAAGVEKTIDLDAPVAVHNMKAGAFARVGGPPQLLFRYAEPVDGCTYELRDLDNRRIWAADLPPAKSCIATSPRDDGHRDIFGQAKDLLWIADGRTGEVLLTKAVKDLPDCRGLGDQVDTPLNLTGGSSAEEFVVKEGANGLQFWVLDRNLDLLWHATAPSGMGHSSQLCPLDLDGDGREEFFVGGALWSPDGRRLWVQDDLIKGLKVPNGGHVDSAQMGFFGGPDEEPTLHLQGSSAGYQVVEARTGRTIITHAQGHVQGGTAARFTDVEPGIQVAGANRWGNYGILGVYSWDGRRIGRFQPDYRSDDVGSINWTGAGTEHLMIVKDPRRAGFYNVAGRRIVDLSPIVAEGYDANIPNVERDHLRLAWGDNPRDRLIFRIRNRVQVIAQDPSFPIPAKPVRAVRRSKVSVLVEG